MCDYYLKKMKRTCSNTPRNGLRYCWRHNFKEVSKQDEECCVCLNLMDKDQDLFKCSCCKHTTHRECLEKWGKSKCPLCRHEFELKQEDEEYNETCCVCFEVLHNNESYFKCREGVTHKECMEW